MRYRRGRRGRARRTYSRRRRGRGSPRMKIGYRM